MHIIWNDVYTNLQLFANFGYVFIFFRLFWLDYNVGIRWDISHPILSNIIFWDTYVLKTNTLFCVLNCTSTFSFISPKLKYLVDEMLNDNWKKTLFFPLETYIIVKYKYRTHFLCLFFNDGYFLCVMVVHGFVLLIRIRKSQMNRFYN